jgi:AcrR family transcriptional regulator
MGGRTRGSRADGERTRERILHEALPLFAANGYAGTSIRAVASAAECNVATLAYHFQDKDGLYLTVVQRLHEDLAEGFPLEAPPAGTPREALRWWIEAGWRFANEHAVHIRLLWRHLLDTGSQPDVVMERWSEPLMQRAEAVIGAFRPEWASPQRRLLVLSLMHLTVRFVIEDDTQLARQAGLAEEDLETALVDWLAELAARELGLS